MSNKGVYSGGPFTPIEDDKFADIILKPSASLDEAVRRSRYKDERDRLNIEKLMSYLNEFNITKGQDDLRHDLDSRVAEGGFHFPYVIMGHSKIPIPSAMGVNLTKEQTRQAENDIKREREMRRPRYQPEEEGE